MFFNYIIYVIDLEKEYNLNTVFYTPICFSQYTLQRNMLFWRCNDINTR